MDERIQRGLDNPGCFNVSQLAMDIPDKIAPGFRNPLPFALSMIWAGNALIGLIALGVMRRLHRH